MGFPEHLEKRMEEHKRWQRVETMRLCQIARREIISEFMRENATELGRKVMRNELRREHEN